MAIEVFNRHENKYLIDDGKLLKIQSRISDYMELDAYNQKKETYTITNLYYDTADNYLIRTSLRKPKYKEKLRLRGYGVLGLDDKVYLEIKKKVAGLVNKRRSTLRLNEAYQFLQTGVVPEAKAYQNRQVLREIEYILKTYELKPMLYLAYDRRAYFDRHDRSLRISFDTNIRTRRYDLRLEAGDYGQLLLPAGQWLMEIKAGQSMPIWLVRLLSENEVYPASFSKYGTEYKQTLQEQSQPVNTIAIPALIPRPANAAIRPPVYSR